MPGSLNISTPLIQSSKTLSVAESVTAGHIQALLSLEQNATQFYQGGVTAYNIDQKVKLLQVDYEEADKTNCVSSQVAEEMSLGAAKMFGSDYSVAITGYATPVPEQGILDLYAYVAVSFQGKVLLSKKIVPTEKETEAVQKEFASTALALLEQVILA
jgi:nicotinamide-nucleotide amidase